MTSPIVKDSGSHKTLNPNLFKHLTWVLLGETRTREEWKLFQRAQESLIYGNDRRMCQIGDCVMLRYKTKNVCKMQLTKRTVSIAMRPMLKRKLHHSQFICDRYWSFPSNATKAETCICILEYMSGKVSCKRAGALLSADTTSQPCK